MNFRYGKHHVQAPELTEIRLHIDALLIHPDYSSWWTSHRRPSDDPTFWLVDLSCCWGPWDGSDCGPLAKYITVDPEYLVWRPDGRIVQTSIPVAERRRVLSQFRHTCIYCDRPGVGHRDPDGSTWNVDHYIPIGRGGVNKGFNYVLACERCNVRKSTNLRLPSWSVGHYDERCSAGIQRALFDLSP